jgi:hypothetical protein
LYDPWFISDKPSPPFYNVVLTYEQTLPIAVDFFLVEKHHVFIDDDHPIREIKYLTMEREDS